MADHIKYAIHKMKPADHHHHRALGRFTLAFDNLTKDEAAEYLLLLMKHQQARDPVPNLTTEEHAEIDGMVATRLMQNAV